jgi:hypothetical protein
MGGRGSGWQYSSAPMVERAEKIDPSDLKQHSADFAQGEALEAPVRRPAHLDIPSKLRPLLR